MPQTIPNGSKITLSDDADAFVVPEDRPNKMVHGESEDNRDKKRSKANLATEGEDIFEQSH